MLRSFSIRTRMNGAIAMVMAVFAVIALAGLFGGARLKSLNADFMATSVQQIASVSDVR